MLDRTFLSLFFVLSVSPLFALCSAVIEYTPFTSLCPCDFELVRDAGNAQTISPDEAAFISGKKSNILPGAWASYLQTLEHYGTPLPAYVSSILSGANGSSAYPTLGLTSSGGGYRAGIFGAGVLNALDGRNASAVQAGTGGLLQCASYLAGLSGSSWLVTSLSQANFPPMLDLLIGPPNAPEDTYGGWLTQIDLASPSPTNSTLQDLAYYVQVISETAGKLAAGYPVTIIDFWARILARHFVNGTNAYNFFDPTLDHGAGVLFSDIANVPSFVDYSMPFPIVVADSMSQYGNLSNITMGVNDSSPVPLLNPLYEFNPFEFGSWDPSLASFTPMKYLGSTNDSLCTTGFDQASFVSATSAGIFNTPNVLTEIINPIFANLSAALNDSGIYFAGIAPETALYPNPFYGVKPESFIESNATLLSLVDGGEDGESIPMIPLLAKGRGIDTIIAIDGGEDVFPGWGGENTLVTTQTRVNLLAPAFSFPPVPASQAELVAEDLMSRPTFFGCNSSTDAPLLVFLGSNAAPIGLAGSPAFNVSVDQTSYTPDALDTMVSQIFQVSTQGMPLAAPDGTLRPDEEWPACLACAVVDRARARLGEERSGVCDSCFARYCWS